MPIWLLQAKQQRESLLMWISQQSIHRAKLVHLCATKTHGQTPILILHPCYPIVTTNFPESNFITAHQRSIQVALKFRKQIGLNDIYPYFFALPNPAASELECPQSHPHTT